MLSQGWRSQIVAATALIDAPAAPEVVEALWQAFDSDSWVSPQLSVVLGLVDPNAPSQMKKRMILGCPVSLRGQEELSPQERYSQHGKAPVFTYSAKCWSSLCWHLAADQEGRDWLLSRFSAEEALGRLLTSWGHEGADNANAWYHSLRTERPDLELGEFPERPPNSRELSRLWNLKGLLCPTATVEALLGERDPHEVLEPLVRPGLLAGDEHFELRAEAMVSDSARVALEPSLRWVVSGALCEYRVGHQPAVGFLQEGTRLPAFTVSTLDKTVHLQVPSPRKRLEGRISLSRDLLQNAGTDAICYGAKDTGEMGGGAAMAVLQACGSEVLVSAREELAKTDRGIGQVVFTPAFRHGGADIVGHIVSIRTRTSQGDWCPQPELLGTGVYRALEGLQRVPVKSVAFSCLATGEGRAKPERIADLMLGAAKKFFKEHSYSEIQVVFCLPNHRDYQAFAKALAR